MLWKRRQRKFGRHSNMCSFVLQDNTTFLAWISSTQISKQNNNIKKNSRCFSALKCSLKLDQKTKHSLFLGISVYHVSLQLDLFIGGKVLVEFFRSPASSCRQLQTSFKVRASEGYPSKSSVLFLMELSGNRHCLLLNPQMTRHLHKYSGNEDR